jgi:Transposase
VSKIREKVLASLPTCPIPEIKRLGKTLKQWREAFLAYFDTGRANNGGTEAINGLIELHRRVARGFRNREHYRLRMLLIGGGLFHPPSGRKSRIRRMLGSLSDVPTSVPGGIPGRTYVEAETPSTAKPDDRPMWPNGDNFEFGAYRARCVAVTG